MIELLSGKMVIDALADHRKREIRRGSAGEKSVAGRLSRHPDELGVIITAWPGPNKDL
jgi:hypothetical protein